MDTSAGVTKFRATEMHSVTLRFADKKLEATFRDFDVDEQLFSIRRTLEATSVFGLLESLVRAVFLEDHFTVFRALCFLTFTLTFIGGRISTSKKLAPFRNITGVIGAMICLAGLSGAIVTAPDDRRSIMMSYLLVVQIFNLILPISHIGKFAISLLTMGTGAWMMAHFDVFTFAAANVAAMQFILATIITAVIAYMQERAQRRKFLLTFELAEEKRRSEQLLLNVLPENIAQRLKDAGDTRSVVDNCPDAVVLFADIVGFSSLTRSMPAAELVRILDDLFSRFDVVADQYGLEKIKTIGDAYMAVAGVPDSSETGTERVAEAALDLIAVIERYRRLSGLPLALRVGFHAGPVVAGVIGRRKFLYDLWGDAVNVAARLEASATPGTVHVTRLIADRLSAKYRLESRGVVNLKGVGEFETFTLLGRLNLQEAAPLEAA